MTLATTYIKQPNQKKQGKCEKQKYFNTVGADIFDKEIRKKKKRQFSISIGGMHIEKIKKIKIFFMVKVR